MTDDIIILEHWHDPKTCLDIVTLSCKRCKKHWKHKFHRTGRWHEIGNPECPFCKEEEEKRDERSIT